MTNEQKQVINDLTTALNILSEISDYRLGSSYWDTTEGSELDEVLTRLYMVINDFSGEVQDITEEIETICD